jgi:hypothetical protein
MYSESDEIADYLFSVLAPATIEYLKFNPGKVAELVREQMQDESNTIICTVTDSLLELIRGGATDEN